MNIARVTVAGTAAQSVANVQAAAARLAAMQNQLSSGNRITTSSDDPDGTVAAMGLRAALARSDQYDTSSQDALAWLSTSDTAFSQSVSVLQSARTLVVKALNSGGSDAGSAAAVAKEIEGLRSTLIQLANTNYDGRPVFGGTTANATAYDANGTYVGDDGTVVRAVAPNTNVAVGARGTDVFGDAGAGTDVFSTLAGIAATLNSSTALSGTSLDQLDAAISRVSSAQASAGSTYQQVQRLQTARTASDASLTTRLSGIEQIDIADMAVRTAAANTAYQAALQTTATIGRQSLLDFLR